ncbi:glycosyltransferase [Vicingus serpentipes]|uniref:Glycosyltransferase n=1 Tax=Vicingus serpentipes TaxID=1926625 RepID=A0A5C6RP04_9FLAO|nr:glycosyltransferase [Vicingus serpentipes]TXB63714.1 glycosyltransferase [Vicingus serpentipes]
MKPKILIFIDWFKPGFKAGGPIRSISNLVSQLNTECDFHIVTRDTDYLETTPYANIKSNEWNSVDDAQVFYLSKENQNKKNILKLIQEINPNIIYCNSLYSPKFTLIPIIIAKKLNIKTILAIRGMLSSGSLAVKSKKKKVFIRLVKLTGLFNKTLFHATTIDEKKDILNTFGDRTKIKIAENLSENKEIKFLYKTKKENELNIVFIGRIAPEKNTLYAIQVLSNCTQKIKLDIFGPIYNEAYFKQCKNAINQLPSNIVIDYKGVLNHDMLDETLINYHVIYLPSTGENFGHSIIEGMTNSCIPVISNKTPWQNLEEQNIGFDIDLACVNKFSEAIDSLAKMNEIELNKMRKNSFCFASNVINNKETLKKYLSLFDLN